MFKINFINGLYELSFYPDNKDDGELIGYFTDYKTALEAGYATKDSWKEINYAEDHFLF
ncbi:MAG: hypothetical protein RLZZ338_1423 [Cyanobacteriota bacterium]|jgi:hypothetical protein